MRVDSFRYELPPKLIAQHPAPDRESARLLCLPPKGGEPENRRVSELPELLPPGALVVVNDTRVLPARLIGRKRDSGGGVELLLLERVGTRELAVAPGDSRRVEIWHALGRANKPLRPGTDVVVTRKFSSGDGRTRTLMVRVLGLVDEDGVFEVALSTPDDEAIDSTVRACGLVPLPPYIRRDAEPEDAERYQTVYAHNEGAVAAPTAGLHLTTGLLRRLDARGCQVTSVTLHVGVGTFRPVTEDDLDAHRMHHERYTVSQSAAEAIATARERRAPVVAIGTSTVRALETAADPGRIGHVIPASAETRLLVQPGHEWRVVDALLTNFHLPRSTLLALVCAFGGTERVLEAYRLAAHRQYRFLSYGDAMLLWRQL